MKYYLLFFSLITIFASCSSSTSENDKKEEPQNTEKENLPETSTQDVESYFKRYGMDPDFEIPKGLKRGEVAPKFTAPDQNGKMVVLEELLKEGPVVIQFYRGQWCPVCTRYLAGFTDSLSLITDKGAKVLAIGPESAANALITAEKSGVPYPLIPDQNLQILDAYKVTFKVTDNYTKKVMDKLGSNLSDNATGEARLPVPATYVVGQDGIIKYVQFDPDYSNRASVQNILKYL